MFTGLIQDQGIVEALTHEPAGVRLRVRVQALAPEAVALGDSVAVSGVCLTVIRIEQGCWEFQASPETLALTSLGQLQIADAVNLELAMQVQARFGGHIVSGHVDGMGSVQSIQIQGEYQVWRFDMPRALARYVAKKGSIAVDGVSLTVNAVGEDWFEVCLIPHTLAVTNLGGKKRGSLVNLEVDLIARYTERLLQFNGGAAHGV